MVFYVIMNEDEKMEFALKIELILIFGLALVNVSFNTHFEVMSIQLRERPPWQSGWLKELGS